MDKYENISVSSENGIHQKIDYRAIKQILSEPSTIAKIIKEVIPGFRDSDVTAIEETVEKNRIHAEVWIPDETDNLQSDSSEAGNDSHSALWVLSKLPVYQELQPVVVNIGFKIPKREEDRFIDERILLVVERFLMINGSSENPELFHPNDQIWSIWISMNAPKRLQNTMTKFSFAADPIPGYKSIAKSELDCFNIVTICPGSPEQKNYTGPVKMIGDLLHHCKA